VDSGIAIKTCMAHGLNPALGFVEGYDRAAVEYRDTRPKCLPARGGRHGLGVFYPFALCLNSA
jgi:hypothetical protein